MVKSMLDLDVFRDGKTITVQVTMDAFHRYLVGNEDTILNIDLDKGNVDALCFLDKDGFYQPHETDNLIVECNGGKISFDVLDIEYNMFEPNPAIDEIAENDPNDDRIKPHAVIKFTLKRSQTPQVEYKYNDFNPATKAILDSLHQRELRYHNAWRSEDFSEEYVSSVPGDALWEPGIPSSFKYTVADNGKEMSVVVSSFTHPFDKADKQKILACIERVNKHEKSVQIRLSEDMVLYAKASINFPSAVEVSAGATEMLLCSTHFVLGKVYDFIHYGLEIGAL